MKTLPRLTHRTFRLLGDSSEPVAATATTSPAALAASALGSLSSNAAAALAVQNPGVPTVTVGGYALPSSPQAAQAGNMAAVIQAALELNAGSITQAQFDQIYAGLTVPPVISSSSAMPGADMNPAQTAPAVTAAASPYAYGGGDYSTSATDTDNGGRGGGGN